MGQKSAGWPIPLKKHTREEAGTQEDCSVYDNFRLLMSAVWQNNVLVLFKIQARDLQIICIHEILPSMPHDRKKFNRNWNWSYHSLKRVSQSSSPLNMWVRMISFKAHVRQKNWPKYNICLKTASVFWMPWRISSHLTYSQAWENTFRIV